MNKDMTHRRVVHLLIISIPRVHAYLGISWWFSCHAVPRRAAGVAPGLLLGIRGIKRTLGYRSSYSATLRHT